MDILWLIVGVLAFVGSIFILVDVIKGKKIDKSTLIVYSIIVTLTTLGWVFEDLRKVIA